MAVKASTLRGQKILKFSYFTRIKRKKENTGTQLEKKKNRKDFLIKYPVAACTVDNTVSER